MRTPPLRSQAGDTSVLNASLNGSLNASFASVMESLGGGGIDGTPNRSFTSMRSAVRAAIPKNFVKDRARAIEGIKPMAGMTEDGGGSGGVDGKKADPVSSGETSNGMTTRAVTISWVKLVFRATTADGVFPRSATAGVQPTTHGRLVFILGFGVRFVLAECAIYAGCAALFARDVVVRSARCCSLARYIDRQPCVHTPCPDSLSPLPL